LEKGFTIWLTGKPGSGKTTLANLTAEALIKRGLPVEVFDGGNLRKELWPELGFSAEERMKNALRIAYFCHLFNRNGINCVVAAIAPYQIIRRELRNRLENYIEISLQASDKILRSRDTLGLYLAAEKGELKQFTGIDDPYENPHDPDLTIYSDSDTEENSLELIINTLQEMNFIEPVSDDYSEEEKKQIDERLRSLGYL
jgi:adenylylsulfate kinase